MKYRIYIDEVGNSDLGSSQNPNQRYLSLTAGAWLWQRLKLAK